MVLSANNCGVNLRNADERTRWKALAKLPYRVARYPCPETLQRLGIKQCFDELCNEGQLNVLFTGDNPSYQRLTLEFLTTLKVEMNRREIVAMTFRLRNEEFRMTMEEFKALYGFTGENFAEPHQFNKDTFWMAITAQEEVGFMANRAKGSMIRNPVLRMIQKACVALPFARHEQGSVQRDELFLLWSILNKRPMNLGHYMIKHLQRQSKKTTCTLCCGAVVSTIALHLGVRTDDFVSDIGDTLMDFEYLRRTSVIVVDQNKRAYFLQRAGDHYPLPDPVNTYVNGPDFRANWGMNGPDHRAALVANPPVLPYRDGNPSWIFDQDHPPLEVPELEMEAEHDEEDEEEPTHHGADGAGTSNTRRRGREERLEQEIISINQRLGSLEVNVQQLNDQQEAHWARWTAQSNEQWGNINAQWGNFNALNDERWTTFMQQQQEFMARWQPPHHPPEQ